MDNGSEHVTWVDGRRLIKGRPVELKHGMILSFGKPHGMTPARNISTLNTHLKQIFHTP